MQSPSSLGVALVRGPSSQARGSSGRLRFKDTPVDTPAVGDGNQEKRERDAERRTLREQRRRRRRQHQGVEREEEVDSWKGVSLSRCRGG